MKITIVGEALIDVVPNEDGTTTDRPGGSPANVAITLGRLGREPHLVTSVASDARGASILEWLGESGVDVVVAPTSSGRTSTAAVVLAEDGSASYEFDLDWDLPTELLADATAGADVVHSGSIATVLDPGCEAVEAAMAAAKGNALVTFDPNARPAITPDVTSVRARVERLVALSDVTKVSDEDLGWYYPGEDVISVAQRWQASGPALVVVTLGGDGAHLVTSWGVVTVPGVKVSVVDTIGAGDTFMGALIDALVGLGAAGASARTVLEGLTEEQLIEVGTWAARAAAVTVSRAGANPPTRAELTA
jgi:fructokinase